MLPYKPKFSKQPYQPKFKSKDLIAIARKICSNDWYKSTIDPVEFEWKPKHNIVYLHMSYGGETIDPQNTWTLAFPIRPFEIGYEKWIEEIRS
jgi:hypothetical protein